MRLARRLRQQTEEPITPSQISALAVVEYRGPLTIGELASFERVQPPTMTRIVDLLQEQALVLRETDTQDRRIVRVSITSAGKRLLEGSRRRKTAYLASRLRGLTDADRQAIEHALPLIERLIEENR